MSSGANDLRVVTIPIDPAGIDDQWRVLQDKVVVHGSVIGGDEHAVLPCQRFLADRRVLKIELVFTHAGKTRHVRIGVGQHGALLAQVFHHLDRQGFPHVVHVLLVGDAEDQDAAAVDSLAACIERVGEFTQHPFRHAAVDLTGELDERVLSPYSRAFQVR